MLRAVNANIPFPLSTSPGHTPQESAGRLINCFAEPRGEGKGPVWHRAPGSSVFAETTETGFRGGLQVGANLFGAWEDDFKRIASDGMVTDVDTLSGTDNIFIARNNAASPDIAIVCQAGAFVYDPDEGDLDDYPDIDVGSPTCCCGFGPYIMFGYGNGMVRATGINTTDINTLDNTTAESNPDGVTNLWPYEGRLYVAGTGSIEIYSGNPPNATGFPLNRIGYNVTPGLISPFAVAGYDQAFGQSPIYVGSDSTVRWLQGDEPVKISPPFLDYLIEQVADKSELVASVYIAGGHPFWQLSCADWTWVFNLNNQKWHERKSYLLKRSRMSRSVHAFDNWLTGDTQSGNLLSVEYGTQTEAGSPLIFELESGAVEDFPNRVRVPRADIKVSTGVGIATGTDPIQTDPTIEVEWSDDGGVRWTDPWLRKLGRQARADRRVTLLGSGISGPMGRKWRLKVADPVQVSVMGGTQSTQVRAY